MKYSLLKIKKMGSRLLLLLFKMKKRRGFNSKWRRIKKKKALKIVNTHAMKG